MSTAITWLKQIRLAHTLGYIFITLSSYAMATDKPIEVSTPSKQPLIPEDVKLSDTNIPLEIRFSEEDFLTSHGLLKTSSTYKKGQYYLKASILGTAKEKKNIKKECAYLNSKNFLMNTNTPEFGCAYLQVQEEILENDAKKSVKKIKIKKQIINTQAKWNKTSTWSYRDAINYLDIKDLQNGLNISKFAKNSKCDTAIATTALISNLEEFLPNEQAWESIQSNYESIATCLAPQSTVSEQLHLRMGLLYILKQNNDKAKEALNKALEAQQSPEEFRTLFWRGYIEEKNKLVDNTLQINWNPYWQKLIVNYPLTQHALLLHGLFLEHPIGDKNEIATMAPYIGSTWDLPNLSSFIFLNLITTKDNRTLKEFTEKIQGKIASDKPQPGIFLATAFKKAGKLQESMRMMYAHIKNSGSSALNLESIKLLYPVLYLDPIKKYSKDIEIPLVLSLIRQESSFVPTTQSLRGAMGLMQILPATAKGTKKFKPATQNLTDPHTNIQAGCAFLAKQLKSFDSNEVLTLSAYNAGPTYAKRWKKRYPNANPLLYADLIPFTETRAYVSGVLRGRFWYRYLIDGKKQDSQSEIAYAEHLLEQKLNANLDSKKTSVADNTLLSKFLARPLSTSNNYMDSDYTEDY